MCYARVAGRQHEGVVPRHMQTAVLRVVAVHIHSRPCRTLLDSQVRRRAAVVHAAAAALARLQAGGGGMMRTVGRAGWHRRTRPGRPQQAP